MSRECLHGSYRGVAGLWLPLPPAQARWWQWRGGRKSSAPQAIQRADAHGPPLPHVGSSAIYLPRADVVLREEGSPTVPGYLAGVKHYKPSSKLLS